MALAGFIYIVALTCFGVAGVLLVGEDGLTWSRDQLFWGGGHLLQFVYAALMVTNWSILARMSLGDEAVDDRVFLFAVLLIALIALPAPAFTPPSSRSPPASMRLFACCSSGSRRRH